VKTKVTSFAVRLRLVVALVIPFFIYCDCVYFTLDSYSLRKLTVACNDCVRYVYRRRFFDHISDVYDSILDCILLTYIEFRLACLMFSLVTGGRPRYLYDSLVFSRSARTLEINSPTHSFVLIKTPFYKDFTLLNTNTRLDSPLSTWLDLYWPVESGFGACSRTQRGLPHHFTVRDFLWISY
jgi:hypothetical protein